MGRRTSEARRAERLLCESCREGSQRWEDGGKKLCGSCYRFAEEKRAAKRGGRDRLERDGAGFGMKFSGRGEFEMAVDARFP